MTTISSVKISILFLYRRIFVQKWFRVTTIFVGSVVLAWGLCGVMGSIFQCVPIEAQWNTAVLAYCINYAAYWIVISVINVVTDFVLLALPIRPVWQLQTSTRKKWMLTGTFAVGCWYVEISSLSEGVPEKALSKLYERYEGQSHTS